VKLAAQKIEQSEIRMLEKNVRYCEANISEISTSERKQKNIEFHRLIAEATKNPVLALTIDYVMDFLFDFKIKNLIYNPDFAMSTIQGHWDILAMLKARDADGAEKAMIRHLRMVEECFSGNKGKD
jgi:GntR family transcriptional regulator, transcriptional repressor for pyruvate dehydrogenase complex